MEAAGCRASLPPLSDSRAAAEERIAARRRRIADRLDAERRKALGEDVEAKVDEEEEWRRRTRQQIEESRQRLAKLLCEGTQMVSNIQVAADMREARRRAEEADLKLQRVEKLEREAKSSMQQFEEITSKWASAEEMTIPEELWQLLNEQQQRCALLLQQKNRLITELQQELKHKDEEYVQAIKKQSEDIHLLLERMEEQIRVMLKAYRRKLLKIEKAFERERRELLDRNRKKWEEAIEAHKARELEYLHARVRKIDEFEQELRRLQLQDEEEYKSMKMQLETDAQNLQRQLQHVKAAYQLNQGKLAYNLEVLMKRDQENTIIRSQQKRKLNRLRSLLDSLRKKLAQQEQRFREENQHLAADCEQITRQCKEVQRRMRHFAVSDTKKFEEVWRMNEEEAKGLLKKALDADRIIHTQQLGLPWEEPRSWCLNNIGPLGHPMAKRRAIKLAAEVLTGGRPSPASLRAPSDLCALLSQESSAEGGKERRTKSGDGVRPLRSIPRKTAKRILELLSDELGFLTESKLLQPLRALGRHEHTLAKLSSIFAALRIETEGDLYQLLEFFLQSKGQEVAVSQVGTAGTAVGRAQQSWGSREGGAEHLLNTQGRQRGGQEDSMDIAEDREDSGSSAQPGSLPSLHFEADDVLKILKAFVLREKVPSAKEVLPDRDNSKDAEYWEALANVIPEPRLKLWDALAVALEEYYEVLKRRASLLAKAATLRQENSELSLMLEKYLSSGVSTSPSSLQPGDIPARVSGAKATARSPLLSGSRYFSPQVNSKLPCPPTQRGR
ncbi:dynein regulatory complex protein 1 [Porphyrio hochstetteri]